MKLKLDLEDEFHLIEWEKHNSDIPHTLGSLPQWVHSWVG